MSGKMSSSSAFTYAASGSMSEKVASVYDQQMNNFYSSFSGLNTWLGDALKEVKENHDYFMRSRLWEFGKKLKGGEGMYVGRYEVGYLGGLDFQREAEGFMRDIIMANPSAMELYQAGRISGYGGELADLNFGIGRENFYYNKVNNGYVEHSDEGTSHTRFLSTRDNHTSYSTRERHDAHRTWRATDVHIRNGYDPTISILGDMDGKVLSVEEGLKALKAMNEKENTDD